MKTTGWLAICTKCTSLQESFPSRAQAEAIKSQHERNNPDHYAKVVEEKDSKA